MLKDKNAIITGANGGIGRAIVETFAKNGSNIWACMRHMDNEYEKYLNSLANEYNVIIEPIYFDMTNSVEMKEAVKQIVRSKRNIDVLINNAGVAQYDAFSLMPMENLTNVFEINYYAPIQFTQLVSRRMSKDGASIVFVSSVSGLDAVCGNTAYGASKAALAHTARVLAKELSTQGIRVNAIAPGMVDTQMKNKADEKTWESLIALTSLKRVAKPEEIANVICFLSSELSSYITGQVIRVDGGMS